MLGALKLSDPRYTWIVPALPYINGTVANPTLDSRGSLLVPHIPTLMVFANSLANAKKAGKLNIVDFIKGTTDAERFCKLGDFEFNPGYVCQFGRLPAINRIPDYDTDFRPINRFMKNANFPQVAQTANFKSIEDVLFTSDSMSWFSQLIKHASVEADFFKAKTNLSKISPSSDLSMLTELTYDIHYAPTPMTMDKLKTAQPFDDNTEHFLNFLGPHCNAHTRVVATTGSQFQIGLSCSFIHHQLAHDANAISTSPGFTSIDAEKAHSNSYAGPYFLTTKEQYPFADNSYIAESNLNIAKVNESFSSPSSNFSSLLVEHFFLEKGKRT
jgi:hypothetical protein